MQTKSHLATKEISVGLAGTRYYLVGTGQQFHGNDQVEISRENEALVRGNVRTNSWERNTKSWERNWNDTLQTQANDKLWEQNNSWER